MITVYNIYKGDDHQLTHQVKNMLLLWLQRLFLTGGIRGQRQVSPLTLKNGYYTHRYRLCDACVRSSALKWLPTRVDKCVYGSQSAGARKAVEKSSAASRLPKVTRLAPKQMDAVHQNHLQHGRLRRAALLLLTASF